VRLIVEPSEAVVVADVPEEGLAVKNVDRGLLGRAAPSAQAAARALVRIDHGNEHGVL
jgi:hypothetical protein